jgi:MFS family permease
MPPLVVMTIIACVERRSWMPLAQLTTMTLVALAIAAPWLHYLLATRQDCVPQPQQWFQAGIKHLLADLFSDRSYGRPFDRNSILHAVAVAGLFGTLQAVRRRDYAIIGLGVAGVWCLIVAYTFSFVPALRAVQPYRFLTPAIIAMLAPAVAAVMEAFAIVKAATRPMQIVVAALVVVMLPALTASVLDLAQPPIPCGLLPADRHLLDTLKAMPTTGRVLCQPETVAHLVPLWTGKPVLGGLNDQAFLRHRHAGFLADGRCFGRTAGEWSETDFTRALIDFKVDVVVLSTPEWIEFARTMPRVLRCEQSSAEYSIWRVVR